LDAAAVYFPDPIGDLRVERAGELPVADVKEIRINHFLGALVAVHEPN
jgi:hypothetical protein